MTSERGVTQGSYDGHDPREVRAIVLGHGDFASGLISAVAQITGRGSLFLPLSNQGLSGERLEETLRAAIDACGAIIVFTDLPGGSWTIAARRVQRERPALVVVTGVSLPMLLDVTFGEDRTPEEAAQSARERGRAAMLVAPAPRTGAGGRGPDDPMTSVRDGGAPAVRDGGAGAR